MFDLVFQKLGFKPKFPSLESLFFQANLTMTRQEKIVWLRDLFQWLRRSGSSSAQLDFNSGAGQYAKIRYMIQILDRNPEIRTRVGAVLWSLLRDLDAIDLFSTVGISSSYGFFSELVERLYFYLLPSPPRDRDLGEVFYVVFPEIDDVLWIKMLDHTIVTQLLGMIESSSEDASYQEMRDKFSTEIKEAIVCLCVQVQAQMLNPLVRDRLPHTKPRDSVFYNLESIIRDFFKCINPSESATKSATSAYLYLRKSLELARTEIAHVHKMSDELGVSVNLVFSMDRVEFQLTRIGDLARILLTPLKKKGRHIEFFTKLIETSASHRSIRDLVVSSLATGAKRITLRNAEIGELYITRTRSEYCQILRKSFAGGILTSMTATLKALTELLHIPYVWMGVLTSVNYATSFSLIQLAHATLATKQPAMTATALSARMQDLEVVANVRVLLDDIVHLIRSQIASVLGNIAGVVPAVACLVFTYQYFAGEPLLDKTVARKMIEAHSLFGPTPFYACITGVFLWLGSLAAGWVDNWAAYRRLYEAMEYQSRLIALFGKTRTKRFADFLRHNTAGIGGNVALGILIGLVPKLVYILGIPLDSRHVTLSTGVVSLAAFSLGLDVLTGTMLTHAILGILACGVFNIGVSFSLAFFVAMRSRGLQATTRSRLYRMIGSRIFRKPWQLLLAPKV